MADPDPVRPAAPVGSPTSAEGPAPDWSALVAEHGPGLLRYARRLTRDFAEAEDLVADTFERALRHAESFRGDANIGTWLHRVLHNVAVDHFRRRARTGTDTLTEEVIDAMWSTDEYSVDPGLLAERASLRTDLEDALVRLPYEHRAAVVLHDVEGWTVPQIAVAHGLDLEVAKQRVRRGRRMLVSALAEVSARRRELRDVPLRCWDARALVGDYLDGELDDGARRLVDAHLRTCPTCPPLVAALVGAERALGTLADRDRDPDRVLAPELLRRIEARHRGEVLNSDESAGR